MVESKTTCSKKISRFSRKSNHGSQKLLRKFDFRKINENIVDDKFPLPSITDILDSLSGSIYFTHLDFQQGYYQVRLAPENILLFYQYRALPIKKFTDGSKSFL